MAPFFLASTSRCRTTCRASPPDTVISAKRNRVTRRTVALQHATQAQGPGGCVPIDCDRRPTGSALQMLAGLSLTSTPITSPILAHRPDVLTPADAFQRRHRHLSGQTAACTARHGRARGGTAGAISVGGQHTAVAAKEKHSEGLQRWRWISINDVLFHRHPPPRPRHAARPGN